VPDKGLDAVFVFKLDAASGALMAAEPPSVASRPGAGPRHADFHPSKPYVYVINELDSTITTFRFDPERGGLTPLQTITTLPPNFTGNSTTSEIVVAPSGRFLYGSNRGHDSLAIFAIDDATGTLTSIGWESTQGKTPRFFAIEPSGTFLYAANQDSDTIVTFRVDQASGKLTPTGHIVKTGSPSTIVFR
jgi:6-phosphogluconolactonase (cycloisomerase 2 family)